MKVSIEQQCNGHRHASSRAFWRIAGVQTPSGIPDAVHKGVYPRVAQQIIR